MSKKPSLNDELVNSCETIEQAKSFLSITLLNLDLCREDVESNKKFSDLVTSVFDDLLIVLEYHKRKGTKVDLIEDDIKTVIAYPRITGQAHLGWYLGVKSKKLKQSYKKVMKASNGRMNEHFKEYGTDNKEKHFVWLKGGTSGESISIFEEHLSLIEAGVKDDAITKKDAWDLFVFYNKFFEEYLDHVGLIEIKYPTGDMGFRFVLDDGTNLLEIEYKSEKFEYYYLNRDVDDSDVSEEFDNVKDLRKFVEKFSD